VAATFTDQAVSGAVPLWQRPGGRAIRSALAAHAGLIRHLIVLKLDRLGRSTIDVLSAIQWLDNAGVTLHIVDFGGTALSTLGPLGRVFLAVMAGMAEFERELIRSRIQDRFNLKRERNELTGTVPYGWNAVPTGSFSPKNVPVRLLTDNEAEQQWICHMLSLREAGLSYQHIADDLNRRKVPTKNAGQACLARGKRPFTASGRWCQGQVRKILLSRTVRDWLARKQSPVQTGS